MRSIWCLLPARIKVFFSAEAEAAGEGGRTLGHAVHVKHGAMHGMEKELRVGYPVSESADSDASFSYCVGFLGLLSLLGDDDSSDLILTTGSHGSRLIEGRSGWCSGRCGQVTAQLLFERIARLIHTYLIQPSSFIASPSTATSSHLH